MLLLVELGYGQTDREAFINDLIAQMTLQEKVGQMTNLGLTALVEGGFWTATDSLVLDEALMKTYLQRYAVGSIQGKGVYPPTQHEWQRLTATVQAYAKEHSRLGIPLLIGIDAVHGAHYTANATTFPHQLGLGASFNTSLVQDIGAATSQNLLASGIQWNFAPVLDLAWQPLWGRIEETFSADPHVVATLGAAFVKGAQQTYQQQRVVACLKHWVGYSFPFSGKDRSPIHLSPIDVQQFFMPPFKSAITAGASSVMLNSGALNGVPGHVDAEGLAQLKEEWGFSGFVVSDWDDLTKLVDVHRVAADYKEATRQAVMAGMDMCMVPYDSTFSVALVELVQEGAVPMARIDDAVRRILRVKYDIGSWEAPVEMELNSYADLALQAATESMVLLKNEGALPLAAQEKVVVAGPGAHSVTALQGPWSRTWKGDDTSYNHPAAKTLVEALTALDVDVTFLPGAGYDTLGAISQEDFAAADKIILVLGEEPVTEKASDIHDLNLPVAQQALVQRAALTGKPIVVVLLQGRPRLMAAIEPVTSAVVHGFYPGQYGGIALARLLTGQANFSAKLPYTYPKHHGSLKGYPYRMADHLDQQFGLSGYAPQWPFGYGQSYTTFEYHNFQCSDTLVGLDRSLSCHVTVTNTGDRAGKEVVQWYYQDEIASVTPVEWRLVGYEKIALLPGQEKEVAFALPASQLQLVNRKAAWVWEPGYGKIGVGPDSKTLDTHRFWLDVNTE